MQLYRFSNDGPSLSIMSQLQIKQIQQPTTAAHGKCLWTFLVSWSFITRPSLRCESCVEVLFVRGSGLCFQCRTPIRKANFRYQLFEDPEVQKEIDIRKKILNEFNRREEDFETTAEYDKYLEKIEEISKPTPF
uniref:CDK-activating kinase assembly factor MAT1 n=1 Tax=Schistocephalus solidus TaxID=70667 RepID=A0A0X3PL02_SCHSO